MNNRVAVLGFSLAVLILYLVIVPSDLPPPPTPDRIYPPTIPNTGSEGELDGANADYHYPDPIDDESSTDVPPDPGYHPSDDDHNHEMPVIPPYDDSIDPIPPTSPPNPSPTDPPNPTDRLTPITPSPTPTPSPSPTPSPTPTPSTPSPTPTPNATPPATPTNSTPTTAPTLSPATHITAKRSPRIRHLRISEADNDTTSSWLDDDGSLRFVTLMYKPDIESLQALRRLVGSIHYFEHETIRLTVFGLDVPQSYYEEVRTFSFVRYVALSPTDSSNPENFLEDLVLQESKLLYARFLFIPLSERLMLNGEGLAKLIQEHASVGPIRVSVDNNYYGIVGQIRGDGTEIIIDGTPYFTTESKDEYGRCTLFRNITSSFRTKYIYAHDNEYFVKKDERRDPEDRLVCVAIATYSGGQNFDNLDEFSLFKVVLPSFLETTREIDTPSSRYRFALYLGTQPDPLYDDPKKLEAIQQKILQATSDRSFSLRMFHTPLNSPAMDITYKWNVLIDQSYRDGCDYIYQYSDDTIFVTPWADQFISYLEAESNFGVVGATDPANPSALSTMTLSFAHRSHITILGSYWPTHLKNWFSDDWAQQVYGKRYTYRSKDVLMSNTQQHGQRYPPCGHEGLFRELMKEESRPKIIAWLKKQPQTYDIRQKLAYFEVQGAEGEKK